MKTQLKGILILLLVGLIWGSSFVSQSVGMESVEGFTFSGIRILLGAFVLLPFILVREKMKKADAQNSDEKKPLFDKTTIIYGIVIGIVFCIAGNFQQFAFNYSTSGKIAFITAMYMFFVPIISIFLKKKIPFLTWLCVVLGFIGLYFLCITKANFGSINKGDILAFVCSIFFAFHIILVERFSPKVDGVKLSFIQFVVGGILSCILMFIFENPQIESIKTATPSILYSGILSCGVAYTLQIVGQKYCEATIASILMCMESVFAAITGAIVLHEILSPREIAGCAIMFSAIILSQLTGVLQNKFFHRKEESK